MILFKHCFVYNIEVLSNGFQFYLFGPRDLSFGTPFSKFFPYIIRTLMSSRAQAESVSASVYIFIFEYFNYSFNTGIGASSSKLS